MDQEFGKMDADKNGQVTRAETEAFQRAVAVAESGARARALFSKLDTDRNGQLSVAEFAKAQSGPPQVNGQPFVTQLDANKDGKVSLVEHRAGKLRRFDNIDSDKDGTVTAAEMRAAGVIK
jgi:Ca2+-binding EF-hand superfamily protein